MIRVILQSPSLARYRVPVFRELANRDGIDLLLLYGNEKAIRSVAPEGFRGQMIPLRECTIAGQPFYWHAAHRQALDPNLADVAVVNGNMRFLSLLPALLRNRGRVGVVLWTHGTSKAENWLRAFFRQRVAALADAVLLYDRKCADQLVASGFPAERVFVAPNSLDQTASQAARSEWLETPQRLLDFRLQHKLEESHLLLHVGRLHRQNRIDLILEAMAQLKETHPTLELALIGEGTDEQNRLRGISQQLGIVDQVRFLGPIYDEFELAPWFLSSRMCVYPSNMGLALLHAFGYGLPVVTGDALHLHGPEVVALRDGKNGMLFRAGDASSLAEKLDAGLKDREMLQHLGDTALDTVLHEFSVEKMVDGMKRAIEYAARR